jgi:hypothetical protein
MSRMSRIGRRPGRAAGAGGVGTHRDPHVTGAWENVRIPARPHPTSLAAPGCARLPGPPTPKAI